MAWESKWVAASQASPGRLHIIGGMGTGKTYLARWISVVLGAPLYEMDVGVDRNAILGKESWVTEGIYLWDVDRILEAADAVVWLDLPYRTSLRRIVIRHVWLSAIGKNRYRGLRKLWSFALSTRRYWKTTEPRPPSGPTDWGALSRAQTIVSLRPYVDKVIRLGSRKEVMSWLAGFSDSARGGGPRT